MDGRYVPLGYDARDRSLAVNEPEADIVRTVFRLYLDNGSVRRVKAEADRRGLVTKIRPTGGGRPLSRGYIYKLLNNPLYAGRIAHKGATYDGLHAAIIDPKTWDAVQAMLANNARTRRSGNVAAEPSFLVGLLYDAQGDRLSPSHAVTNGKRYRYYISHRLMTGTGTDGMRIPSHEIETLVVDTLVQLLQSRTRLFDLLNLEQQGPAQISKTLSLARRLAGELSDRANGEITGTVRALLNHVTVARTEVRFALSTPRLCETLCLSPESIMDNDPDRWTVLVPARLRRDCGAIRLIIVDDATVDEPEFDPALAKMLTRAHDWFARLTTGAAASAAEIAQTQKLSRPYVTRVLRLAFLAPDIAEAILDGRQPPGLNAERLIRNSKLPLAWDEQRRVLGFARR